MTADKASRDVGLQVVRNLFKVAMALGLGASAYFLANLLQYHFLMQSGLTPEPDRSLPGAMLAAAFGDILVSGVVLVLLLKLCRFNSLGAGLIAAFGLFAMMGVTPSAVRTAPDFYATLYSEAYVIHHTQTGF